MPDRSSLASSPTPEPGTASPVSAAGPAPWRLFVPKLVTALRQGYGLPDLRADLIAGLTVAIVALPLAMALAIASGTTPDKGLVTAIVAGFLISALGGSRYQIGGPTGAFVVVVFNVIAQHGYDGLVLATLMAGVMLLALGYGRVGTYIKYVPYPVVTGFTAGIAVIIFTSQIKDLLGLTMVVTPAEFAAKLAAYADALPTIHWPTVAVAFGSLAMILAIRRWKPQLPVFLIAVVAGSLAVMALGLPVDTIGSRFGGIPTELPTPVFPEITWKRLVELSPSAFTIAFLAGIESLLSAVVADGMTGRKHRSNCELVAQGAANIASALFGGLPATGAIARTATNVRSGARTPVAGMAHAVFLLLFMLALAPLAVFVPLASLAAVLVIVAWNMAEVDHFRHLMKAPVGDRVVLILTFSLTVLVDLTVAIQVGVVLAAFLFMHRMANAVEVETHTRVIDDDEDDFAKAPTPDYPPLPEGVEVYRISGPFFFGAAAKLGEVLDRIRKPPRVFILRMRLVPLIDATGGHALEEFLRRCEAHGTQVILSGVQDQPRRLMGELGLAGRVRFAPDTPTAIAEAERLLRG
ncbi:MAG: sulfate permease [Caenispirillum sp.]|nr:sulfate permease [Caenispirillum sp.]